MLFHPFYCIINLTTQLKVILEQCSRREIVFLALKHTVYNSTAPASLLRELPTLFPGTAIPPKSSKAHVANRQRIYSPHQYITITVTSDLGHGAVGVVHRGSLEVTTAKGVTYSCDAVIKLAFSEKQQDKMRYEYSIYQHLITSGTDVVGIPSVFGMFKDMVVGGPLALVMSFGGTDIWHSRRPDLQSDEIHLSEDERYVHTLCCRLSIANHPTQYRLQESFEEYSSSWRSPQ